VTANEEPVARRFESRGEPGRITGNRQIALKALLRRSPGQTSSAEDLWLCGVDRRTGAPVLIEPRRGASSWAVDLAVDAAARRVATVPSPYLVPVLHVGPGVGYLEKRVNNDASTITHARVSGSGVVYAEPQPGLPRGAFTVEEAAELAIQACEAAASLHAAGVRDLCFGEFHLRVTGTRGSYTIAWLVPGAHEIELLERAGRAAAHVAGKRPPAPVAAVVWGLADFFLSLLPDGAPARSAALAPIVAMVTRAASLPADVAALAHVLLPLAPRLPPLAASVTAMPSVPTLPQLPLEWDAIIAEGEALLAADPYSREYYELPLASAYHQRASRTWAAGQPAAAVADADRAAVLDGAFLPYAVTRAVLLDALGRRAEARGVLDTALAAPRTPTRHRNPWERDDRPSAAARARAYGTRGMIALHEGDLVRAEADLRRALALCPASDHEVALYAHALGAALYAKGDIDGAVAAEESSVRFQPDNARYRWALVGSLRKLGRYGKAREHAETILARESDAVHCERFTRLFG
jgi:tetratricopeptide (TPR) repeat protein